MTLPRRAGGFALAFVILYLLSACSAATSVQPVVVPATLPVAQDLPEDAAPRQSEPEMVPESVLPERVWVLDVPRLDEQGAVSVEITPLNLNVPGHTLDFSVALNTHSVDLGMDLAALATLTTDTGLELPASAWEAPRGGHHVRGTLQFPSVQGETVVMAGVQRLTLVIRGLDAPERTFVWEK